jgi:hypothetical protein
MMMVTRKLGQSNVALVTERGHVVLTDVRGGDGGEHVAASGHHEKTPHLVAQLHSPLPLWPLHPWIYVLAY